jgi:hypothetical protein
MPNDFYLRSIKPSLRKARVPLLRAKDYTTAAVEASFAKAAKASDKTEPGAASLYPKAIGEWRVFKLQNGKALPS